MLGTILQYLQWAFPYGLGAAIGWLVSSKLRNARTAKEVHDIYKEMYADVCCELQEMRKENEKLYKAFTRLERAVSRAITCRYWPDCPIRSELPDSKERGTSNHPGRHPQPGPHRIRDTANRDASRQRRQREPGDSDGGDTEPPGRRDVHQETGQNTGEPKTQG